MKAANIVKGLLAVFIVLASQFSYSYQYDEKLTLEFHVTSHHFRGMNEQERRATGEQEYNEDNFGLGFIYDTYHVQYTGGYYKNSIYQDSYYLGFGTHEHLGFSVFFGFLSGYEPGEQSVVRPTPMLKYSVPVVPVNLTLIPGGAIGASLEVTDDQIKGAFKSIGKLFK